MKLKIIKVIIIFLTLVEIGYIILMFTNLEVLMKYEYIRWIVHIIHVLVLILIFKMIWSNKMDDKKKKIDKTLMVSFLGIIGMWLWLPKKEN